MRNIKNFMLKWRGMKTNDECIEIHLDAETKQLTEQPAATLGYATLTDFFI